MEKTWKSNGGIKMEKSLSNEVGQRWQNDGKYS